MIHGVVSSTKEISIGQVSSMWSISPFFRPRDLLLFFKPLENGNFSVPLSRAEITTLVEIYGQELAKEVKSELSSFYEDIQVATIFNALGAMSRCKSSYTEALSFIESNCEDVNGPDYFKILFDRSIIGTADSNSW